MNRLSWRRSLLAVLLVTALLLLVPLVAMQFTPEVSWGPVDFLAAAVLLAGAGTGIVLANAWLERRAYKLLAAAAVILVTALVWAELAVGLFD